MSNAAYTVDGQYLPYMVNTVARVEKDMIEIRVDQLLAEHGRTFYWLAKETGISHTTLWRLKKDKALGINFETLEKICAALKCQPGDILALPPAKKDAKKTGHDRRNGRTRK
ncbi:MAG TPA: helix-turn-helix transcriptional regulator [Pyrinomonadaceae bacterium]|nr:helix-turn-helix transcriptional regulator [Pyrinomonadaceae bacterium]